MDLSVIIPAFNEAGSLPQTLADVRAYLAQLRDVGEWEVVVVDDGSTDGTAAAAAGERTTLVRLHRNSGKGAALVAGSAAARGRWQLLMDADSSTPISELAKLRAAGDVDIAFASRAMPGARLEARQPRLREAAGKAGNLLIQLLLLPGVRDSQCGFKLVGPAAVPLLRAVRTQRWGFDVELLAMAKQRNLKLAEVPVTWRHDPTSAVGVGSYLRTLGEVTRIWWRLRK